MEEVGVGNINNIANAVVNEFKDNGHGDVDASIGIGIDIISDPAGLVAAVGVGEATVEPLMLGKITSSASISEEKKKKPTKKKKRSNGTKKPPDAPKRFKSSFIFFSMAKHKEIKENLAKGGDTKVTNITSMVSEAWRTLEPLEKVKFEAMARVDKERYDSERKHYVPPPGMSLTSKRKRDPDAPKRPMSAYLSYANKLRGKVKSDNPDCSNGEISKILSGMWKAMPTDERKDYKENEQALWDTYRKKMVEWKKNNDGRKKGKMADLIRQSCQMKAAKKSKKKKEKITIAAASMGGRGTDFPVPHNHSHNNHHNQHHQHHHHHHAEVDNDGGVDEQLLAFGGVPGMDTNPNTDEMMAASALRGVRGGPQHHLGGGMGEPSHHNNNGYGAFFGMNGSNSMHPMLSGAPGGHSAPGPAGFGQIDMPGFPYNQYGYPVGGNPHAMIMAQLRGAPYQVQYPGFMPMDHQQPNLSQLASLAGVQNDATQQQQQQPQPHLQQQMDQSVSETGMNMGMGNGMGDGNMGNTVLNDNSGGSSNSSGMTPF